MRLLKAAAVIVLTTASLPAQQGEDNPWIAQARAHVAANPENAGLGHLADAISRFDFGVYVAHSRTVDEIVRNGWRSNRPEIAELIRSQAPALRAAVAAAQAEHIEFPPSEDWNSPVPNFLSTQCIAKLLMVEARRLEAAGEPDSAAQRAVQAAQFGDHYCAEGGTLISNLIGVACLSISLKGLESILSHPGISDETLQATGSTLFRLDQGHVGVVEAFRTETDITMTTYHAARDDPSVFAMIWGDPSQADQDPERLANIRRGLDDMESLAADHERIGNAILENLSRPHWEREWLGREWVQSLATNPLLQGAPGPNMMEAATREATAIAHLRICQALCALRLGQPEVAERFLDPYTGGPLHMDAQRIWSLGPDKTDQAGREQYDPANGTVSAGDIVALR
jgi:hypothetical protein